MILGGVFDRYPKLQVVIGHLGEGIPFMLPRLNTNAAEGDDRLDRPLGAYFRENVHYTFAGFNFPATFLDLMLEVGVERIMFSADHPYGSMMEARSFLDRIPVSPADPRAHRARQTRSAFSTSRQCCSWALDLGRQCRIGLNRYRIAMSTLRPFIPQFQT